MMSVIATKSIKLSIGANRVDLWSSGRVAIKWAKMRKEASERTDKANDDGPIINTRTGTGKGMYAPPPPPSR